MCNTTYQPGTMMLPLCFARMPFLGRCGKDWPALLAAAVMVKHVKGAVKLW
jgi:hypothetical protein